MTQPASTTTNNKKKVTLRLDNNEVAIVWTVEMWHHLIQIYETLEEEADEQDKAAWREAADWIRKWLTKARHHAKQY